MRRAYGPATLDQMGRAGIRIGRILVLGGLVALFLGWSLVGVFLVMHGLAGIVGGRRELSRARHLEHQAARTAQVFE